MQNRRVEIDCHGGPEKLQLRKLAMPQPSAGQVLIKHAAIGVNFIDTYHRTGLYPVALPSGLGLEAAGTIESIGDGVSGLKIGSRVAYCGGPLGAYSDYHCVAASSLVVVPTSVSFEQAAGCLLKGLTAAYLLHKTTQLAKGDWILVHAAAGGVGQLLCSWATAMGIRVVGTVGSAAKVATAKQCGCEHVVNYRSESVAEKVREITAGKGMKVVYDGIGRDTFDASIDSLAVRGLLVSFGNASGSVESFEPLLLAKKGSLYITRPTLAHYTADPLELKELATLLMQALERKWLNLNITQRFALADAAKAHQLLESGATQGSLILMPF